MSTMFRPYRFLAAVLLAGLANQAAPLDFEPNLGQTDPRVRFLARGGGITAFFTATETDLVLYRGHQQTVVRMKLEGSAPPSRFHGVEKLPGVSNYFIGNDPTKWRTDVPHYARIQSEDVYPGIDMVWYGNQQRLEYDFVVGPGADPGRIQVAYQGVDTLKVEANGDLILHTALGEMRQQKPNVYQEIAGRRLEVAAHYSILARNRVTFELAGYDRKRELRIDPVVLAYSTYLGGNSLDVAQGVAVDAAGSAYIVGHTISSNFPTLSAFETSLTGAENVFVTKMTPAGDGLVYSTYLGGNSDDYGYGIAVDASGSAYVTGQTGSTNFPTKSAYQPMSRRIFVTKLAPAGNALVYSTFLGGTGEDYCWAIAVDTKGAAYVTGQTISTDFPTLSAYQASYPGGISAFVTKFTPAGSALEYSTYFGETTSDNEGDVIGYGIAVDAAGSAYIAGTAAPNLPTTSSAYEQTTVAGASFVTKLTPSGSGLVYSTYVGGKYSQGFAIAVDSAGSAYITGSAASNLPTTSGAFQAAYPGGEPAFVTKLAPSGSALVYSTYLGGTSQDTGKGIAVDKAGSAYVTGITLSADFPTQAPFQATNISGYDAFVTKLSPAGNALVYSTYLGGGDSTSGYAIAVDGTGAAYVTGQTSSGQNGAGIPFPTQAPYQATFQGGNFDAFVTKLAPYGAGAVPIGSFDTPATSPANVNGSVGFTGWAVSAAGIASIGIYRDPNPGEATQSNGLVYIGTASSITGSRTDIAALYPAYPESNSAGWGFLILTNELPSNGGNTGVGNGTYNIHAIALDLGGNSKDLGVKTIVVDNKDALTPFGGIDTPAQGATVSGARYVNFGWALTPQPKMIPTNGSTIVVYIDAEPMGHPVYNNPRSDIETLFPGYANTDGAIGYFYIDTTKLANGLHTISWGVTDSAGQKSGIGSRFFIVQN